MSRRPPHHCSCSLALLVLALLHAAAAAAAPATARQFFEQLFSHDYAVAAQARAEFQALPATERERFVLPLAAAMHKPDAANAAAWLLGQTGEPAVRHLAAAVVSPEAWLRVAALQGLGALPVPIRAASLRLITPSLADPQPEVQQAARSALCCLGREVAAAVPDLTAALHRASARGEALAAQNPGDGSAMATIERQQLEIVRMLADAGPTAASAVAELVRLLAAPATGAVPLRGETARALGAIASAPDLAIPALVPLLAEPCCLRLARDALAVFGDAAVPALVQAIGNPNAQVRANAAANLRTIGTPLALAAVATFEHDETARAEREQRQAETTPRPRGETQAPLPPSADEAESLPVVDTFPLRLATGRELLVTIHRHPDGARDQVLSIWLGDEAGYRRLLRQREAAREARYQVSLFEIAGDTYLHLVREERERAAPDWQRGWRLDRLWQLPAEQRLADVPLERPAAGCGWWLPQLGVEESLNVVFAPTATGLRFGIADLEPDREPSGGDGWQPAPPRWLGTLALRPVDASRDSAPGPALVVVGCEEGGEA